MLFVMKYCLANGLAENVALSIPLDWRHAPQIIFLPVAVRGAQRNLASEPSGFGIVPLATVRSMLVLKECIWLKEVVKDTMRTER